MPRPMQLPALALIERRCARPGCEHVFIVQGKHHEQRYCSKSCASRVRIVTPRLLDRMVEASRVVRAAQARERAIERAQAVTPEIAGQEIYERGWHAGYNTGRSTQARVIAELRAQVNTLRAEVQRTKGHAA